MKRSGRGSRWNICSRAVFASSRISRRRAIGIRKTGATHSWALPRPVAVLAVDAHHARQLAEICHFGGVRVPDDVAILAGDADELLCEVSTPPLSSISVACERLGHEAAAMLHRMMAGDNPPKGPVLIAAHGGLSRQSTDVLAIDDPAVV